MSCVVISDVHVVACEDEHAKLLLSFLHHKEIFEVQNIILLGDIFDVLVGGYEEYYNEFQQIFDRIIELTNLGKKIYFIEGNHDFLNSRLEDLINSKAKIKSFHVLKKGLTLKIGDKIFLFEHGDDVEIHRMGYKIYKFFINNRLMNILTKIFIPYNFVRNLGSFMSNKSRDYSSNRFGDELKDAIRDKFRKSAAMYRKKVFFDYLILGHSHIKDYYEAPDFTYINNGFAAESMSFIKIGENQKPEFVSLH